MNLNGSAALVEAIGLELADIRRDWKLEAAERQAEIARALLEIERTLSQCRTRLAELKDGPPGLDAYAGQALGLYDPTVTYRAMDVVAFNGSEWRARRDDPGKLPGDGWMLSARAGARGSQGERGEPGPPGPRGVGVVAAYRRDWQIVLELSDKSELAVDVRGIFEDFQREAG